MMNNAQFKSSGGYPLLLVSMWCCRTRLPSGPGQGAGFNLRPHDLRHRATVLAAFTEGLALGSAWLGPWCESHLGAAFLPSPRRVWSRPGLSRQRKSIRRRGHSSQGRASISNGSAAPPALCFEL